MRHHARHDSLPPALSAHARGRAEWLAAFGDAALIVLFGGGVAAVALAIIALLRQI